MLTSKPGLELFTPGLEFLLHQLIRCVGLGKTRTLSGLWYSRYTGERGISPHNTAVRIEGH